MSASNADAALALALTAGAVLLLWWLSWRALRLLGRLIERLAVRFAGAGAWVRAHPARAVLRRRLPRIYAFLAGRLTPRRFTGLPLTLMTAAAVYLAALLAWLIDELREAEELVAFDAAADALIAPYRGTFLLRVFLWITELGGSAALIAVAAVATGFLWAHGRSLFVPGLWLTFAGSQATTYFGKFLVGRARPEFVTEVVLLSPSFPSGHATGALAVYGFVAYALARDRGGLRLRFELTFWTLVLAALVGLSRVFLSVHYASDVAAGFLVGGFWLLAGFALTEYLRQRSAAPPTGPAPAGPSAADAAGSRP
jgi:membrane-associated phospholipid phosphatase